VTYTHGMRKAVAVISAAAVVAAVLGTGGYLYREQRMEAGRCATVASLDETTAAAIGSGPPITVLGDSYSEGWGLDDPRASWVSYLGMQVTVHASSGAGFTRPGLCNHPALTGLASEDDASTIIQGGINDVDASPEDVTAEAEKAIRSADNPVLLIGPAPAPNFTAEQIAAVDGALSEAAAAADVTYLSAAAWDDLEYIDGLHLTADSHRVFGERVAAAL
jgi:lysophospholipase L1-like esterase